jgi:hypothetical protein
MITFRQSGALADAADVGGGVLWAFIVILFWDHSPFLEFHQRQGFDLHLVSFDSAQPRLQSHDAPVGLLNARGADLAILYQSLDDRQHSRLSFHDSSLQPALLPDF